LHTSGIHSGFFGTGEVGGAQAEAVCVPQGGRNTRRPAAGRRRRVAAVAAHAFGRDGDGPSRRLRGSSSWAAIPAESHSQKRSTARAVERVRALTDGYGVHSVLERVGLAQAMQTAIEITRPGGAVGRPGDPQEETMRASRPAFYNNVSVGGGHRRRRYGRGLRGMGVVGLTVFLARMYALPWLIVSDE